MNNPENNIPDDTIVKKKSRNARALLKTFKVMLVIILMIIVCNTEKTDLQICEYLLTLNNN